MQRLGKRVELRHGVQERLALGFGLEPGQVEFVAEGQRQERRTVAIGADDVGEFAPQHVSMRQDVLRVGGRQLGHHEHADLVSGVEELLGRCHRVEADGVEPEGAGLAQSLEVGLAARRRKSAHHLDVVVAVAAQVERGAIEQQYFAPGRELPHPEAFLHLISRPLPLVQRHARRVQVGRVGRPETGARDGQAGLDLGLPAGGHGDRCPGADAGACRDPHLADKRSGLAVSDRHDDARGTPADVGPHVHVVDRCGIGGAQLDAPVRSAPVADVVQHAGGLERLLLARAVQRHRARVGDAQRDDVVAAGSNGVGHVECEWRAEAFVLAHLLAVDEHGRVPMGARDAQRDGFALPAGGHGHRPAVPGHTGVVVPQRSARLAHALCLPGAGYLDRARKRGLSCGPVPGVARRSGVLTELPRAVEHQRGTLRAGALGQQQRQQDGKQDSGGLA